MKAKQTNNLVLVLSIFFPIAIFSQQGNDRLRLIHADILNRETVEKKVRQTLKGNVKFKQGKTTIQCDAASQILNEDPALLIGHVNIDDTEQSLHADSVYIYQQEKKQIAVGSVKNITETDTTTAHRMTYHQEERKVVSEGNVRIVNPKERTILSGGVAEYFRDQEYGKVFDNPVLIQFDSLGIETMKIEADTMEVFGRGDKTLAMGNVEIFRPGIEATCGQAEFVKETGQITLNDQPKVNQKNQEISGDTLRLYLEDSKLTRAIVTGHALATSDADTLNKGKWVNKLTGSSMQFFFDDGTELNKVIIENQATSLYHIVEDKEYKGANDVSGDKITIELANGEAQKVQVSSDPDLSTGKYSPPGN